MSLEFVGRKNGDDQYKRECDVEGCSNRTTFNVNNMEEKVEGWKVAKMFQDGTVTQVRHICPKHD